MVLIAMQVNSGPSPILSKQLTLSHCLLAPIRYKGLGVCHKIRLKNMIGTKHIGARA